MRVMGYWVKVNSRCRFCGRPREKMYLIKQGQNRGFYCSRNHYELAVNNGNKEE